VLVGERPIASPSLHDQQTVFKSQADALFGEHPSAAARKVGQGVVYATASLSGVLSSLPLLPDFEYIKPDADTELRYLHRKLPDGDIYFISNRRDRLQRVTATFRVSGARPQLWDAVSGMATDTNYHANGERTNVTLDLPAYGSVFVVFRKSLTTPNHERPLSTKVLQTLSGPWSIEFSPNRGAPSGEHSVELGSWSANSEPGIRYFSGTATYHSHFQSPTAGSSRIFLNLGVVHELAEIKLNGKSLGIIWTAPWSLDITDAVRPGDNTLEVAVTNLWVNRLIGDQQPGDHPRYTSTTFPTYLPDAPLRESGLIGPVTLEGIDAH
jgi:hypothetical protein